jgi:hypothetical protein
MAFAEIRRCAGGFAGNRAQCGEMTRTAAKASKRRPHGARTQQIILHGARSRQAAPALSQTAWAVVCRWFLKERRRNAWGGVSYRRTSFPYLFLAKD